MTRLDLQYRHNNGYDSVLLVEWYDGVCLVRSRWTVDDRVMHDFLMTGDTPSNWDNQGLDERPNDYGELCCEWYGDTQRLHIEDEDLWDRRKDFFGVSP